MAVYCSNCGLKNADDASRCTSCEADIKPRRSAGAGMFKGTMLISPAQARPSENAKSQKESGKAAHGTMLMGSLPTAGSQPAPPSPPLTPPSMPAPRRTQPAKGTVPSSGDSFPPRPTVSSEWPGGAFVSQRPAPKTTVVWVLLVLTLLAVTGAAIAGAYAWKAMRDNRHAQTSFAHKLEAETGRLRMGIALHAVRTQCGLDRCAAAAQYFHPSVRETLLAQAPTISERALHVLLTPDLSRAQVLSGTPLAKVAEAARIPPNACIQVRSGQALVIGCTLPYADPQFQILRLEHLETLTP